jgi:glycosyltransferase involved in cell wall biosynthesis
MASNLHHTTDLPAHGRAFSKTKKRRKSSRHQNTRHKRVAILLATKQGERFLPQQLQSFMNQTHPNWTLWVSDDTSTDSSVKLIEQFQERVGEERVRLGIGPGRGHTANFLSLTCDSNIDADYYSYSDQDDIWEADKLARALKRLQALPDDVPAMYCSRMRLIDEMNRDIGLFGLWRKPPSFANALTQNIASGHTILFNRAARNLLLEAGPYVDVPSHDWWCYLLIAGAGGTVLYDSYAGVRHRQHNNNCVGAGSTLIAKSKNMWMLFNNRFRLACDKNIKALTKTEYLLTDQNRQILHRFAEMREAPLISRMIGLHRCGLYRQTLIDNIFLLAGAILKKI